MYTTTAWSPVFLTHMLPINIFTYNSWLLISNIFNLIEFFKIFHIKKLLKDPYTTEEQLDDGFEFNLNLNKHGLNMCRDESLLDLHYLTPTHINSTFEINPNPCWCCGSFKPYDSCGKTNWDWGRLGIKIMWKFFSLVFFRSNHLIHALSKLWVYPCHYEETHFSSKWASKCCFRSLSPESRSGVQLLSTFLLSITPHAVVALHVAPGPPTSFSFALMAYWAWTSSWAPFLGLNWSFDGTKIIFSHVVDLNHNLKT